MQLKDVLDQFDYQGPTMAEMDREFTRINRDIQALRESLRPDQQALFSDGISGEHVPLDPKQRAAYEGLRARMTVWALKWEIAVGEDFDGS